MHLDNQINEVLNSHNGLAQYHQGSRDRQRGARQGHLSRRVVLQHALHCLLTVSTFLLRSLISPEIKKRA